MPRQVRRGIVRLTGGCFKGLALSVPGPIRATEAKVRQALFNILGSWVEGKRVLDGFSGSGALGFEAFSRGASFVAFVESDTEAVLSIRQTLSRLEPELPRSAWRLMHLTIEQGVPQLAKMEPPFDLVILDPPYHSEEGKKALNTVVECAILARAGILVMEHARRMAPPPSAGSLRQWTQHRYGDTVLSFYQ